MRLAAIIVLLFAALFLLAGVLTGSWGDAEVGDELMHWGLTSITTCDEGGLLLRTCKSYSLGDAGWDAASVDAGKVAFGFGLLTVLLCVITAIVTGLEKAAGRFLGIGTMVLNAGAAVAGAAFVLFLPDEATELDPELGSSFYLFIMGCIAGALGSSFASRAAPRPAPTSSSKEKTRPELPAHLSEASPPGAPRGAMPSPVPIPPPPVQVPTCPTCQGDGSWIHERRRFICVRCNRYL